MHLYPHASIYQWFDAFIYKSIRIRTTKNFGTKNKCIINLTDSHTRIDGMHHIGLRNDDVPCCGNKFFLSTDKFCRTFPNKIDFEFTVPVHGDIVKFIWNRTLIIAEWFNFRTMYTIFSGISVVHGNASKK